FPRRFIAARKHAQKFVAAIAADEIVFAELRPKRGATLAQHGVSGRMAERIVDRFEPVEINHDDRQRATLMPRAIELAPELLRHHATIPETREMIARRFGP